LCFYVVLSCVGRGLCDGLITRPEESYRVSVCVWSSNPVWLRKTSAVRKSPKKKFSDMKLLPVSTLLTYILSVLSVASRCSSLDVFPPRCALILNTNFAIN
jgi:hypothetical protein